MDNNVYYFTGTGNSLFIAKKITELMGGILKSIPRVMSKMSDETIGSQIIIVFLSYLAMIYGIPVIVKEFIESVPDLSSKKIIAICSYGGYEIVNAVLSVRF